MDSTRLVLIGLNWREFIWNTFNQGYGSVWSLHVSGSNHREKLDSDSNLEKRPNKIHLLTLFFAI